MAVNLDTVQNNHGIPSFFGLSIGSDSHHQLHEENPEKSGFFFILRSFFALRIVENPQPFDGFRQGFDGF
jgi:hypothetical protein